MLLVKLDDLPFVYMKSCLIPARGIIIMVYVGNMGDLSGLLA